MMSRLRAAALLTASMSMLACEPDECSANFLLGGAIDYQYAWRYPRTECSMRTQPDILDAGIEFENSGNILEITTMDALTVGAHEAVLSYRTVGGDSWSTGGTSTSCVLTISQSEVVDWVREDHRRLKGLVECTGSLSADDGGDSLSVSGLVFDVYTADNGYY